MYLIFDDVKQHLRAVDFDDDNLYIQNLIEMVEELVLTEIQGSVAGKGTIQTAITAGAGTVQTAASVSLVGTNTNFLDFSVGETITVSGETVRTIARITDDTHLTVTVAFSTTASGLTYSASTIKSVIGTDTNFANYQVGDGITVEGQTRRIIAEIIDDTHLMVTKSFSLVNNGLIYTMHPGIPSPIPLGLKQAMLLMIGHFYMIREPVMIGVNVTEVPYGFKYLIAPFKNYTIA